MTLSAHARLPDVASCAHIDGAEALTHCVFPVLSLLCVVGRRNLGKSRCLDREGSEHIEESENWGTHRGCGKRACCESPS